MVLILTGKLLFSFTFLDKAIIEIFNYVYLKIHAITS